MGKIPGYTTTADLPADVQELYELTQPLEGGPVFDLPNFRQTGIDFSKLTLDQARDLLNRKWPGIRLKATTTPEAPAHKTAPTPDAEAATDAKANAPKAPK